jgi:hypothetical protein
MTGSPNHSTFAQIATLDVLRTSDKLDRNGPLEFAAIWLDKKATDTERMLLGGFFDVVSRLKRSPGLVTRPQVRSVSEPVSSPSLPPVPPVGRVSLSQPSARPLSGGQSAVHDRSGLASMSLTEGSAGPDVEDREAAWVEMQDLPQPEPQLVQPAALEASLLGLVNALPTPPIPVDLPSSSNTMSPTAENTYRNPLSDVGLSEDEVWPDPLPGLGEAANAPTASTQALAANQQQMDGVGDHRSPTRWQKVSQAGPMDIKAAKFGPVNKNKPRQARAASVFAEK